MRYFILLSIFVSFIPYLYSQQNPVETGIIKGEVLDRATKEPLIGANILVVGTTIGSSADVDGQFSISRIPIGTYSLRVTAVGYTSFIVTDIVVAVAKPAEVKIFLDESTILVDEVQVTASYFQTIPDRTPELGEASRRRLGRRHGRDPALATRRSHRHNARLDPDRRSDASPCAGRPTGHQRHPQGITGSGRLVTTRLCPARVAGKRNKKRGQCRAPGH